MLYTYVSITYSYFQGILYSFYFINCMETFLFLMCPSDYFDSTFFYHIADLCHPWTFMLSIRETTDTNVNGTDFFTDQSVYLFQDSFVFYGFCRVGAFASVTGCLLYTSYRRLPVSDNLASLIQAHCLSEPVSYTHLDVYKRQLFHIL